MEEEALLLFRMFQEEDLEEGEDHKVKVVVVEDHKVMEVVVEDHRAMVVVEEHKVKVVEVPHKEVLWDDLE